MLAALLNLLSALAFVGALVAPAANALPQQRRPLTLDLDSNSDLVRRLAENQKRIDELTKRYDPNHPDSNQPPPPGKNCVAVADTDLKGLNHGLMDSMVSWLFYQYYYTANSQADCQSGWVWRPQGSGGAPAPGACFKPTYSGNFIRGTQNYDTLISNGCMGRGTQNRGGNCWATVRTPEKRNSIDLDLTSFPCLDRSLCLRWESFNRARSGSTP
jgi:hypothetical protein